ncbi:MAG: nickel pincer cofactor biosynthesis protein LarB [Candidatus Margulisiibacteriota bacterium]|nr:MAG: 1-(5-phosphoribosyl)-5-amino-4-imidazole-carboxylate carboxylase [Candidatus Margulisbacteria bacterium GWD2_39_127]OGI03063.1 MAG: 1-(5-phosphoribosyl)-5-amino-4-imidazole-carboxylate carboxylase [Candidatus Margulisbacteria bacterium GWF2_38_17]OGI11608.1 MAG: 1-(5-phosphoribosyl)-5-amino-4-imidazole-carboxylate carboxylase [Candidatus Margulisbacteria bacterium GWE2_39_32]PZM79916.1 MAG: nickel pincer cofactor biosynthesis protein LarB [Candidatus Margulisiibacteriota bacterium]HAR62
MDEKFLSELLNKYKDDKLSFEETLAILKKVPFEDIGFAKVDHHRSLRKGFPEVIYCPGKTPEQIKAIIEKMLPYSENVLATRATNDVYEFLKPAFQDIVYNADARIIYFKRKIKLKTQKNITVLSAGTADIPVAEEAALTAEFLGNPVNRIYDIGVAGLHRVFAHLPKINEANILIIVAGMEGALPSVVASLTDKPVIAVPTSIGYGTNFNGLTPLFAMLNSCVTGLTLVNIDNGFGAGCFASLINK